MKKLDFYTRRNDDGEQRAVLVHGYTDNKFYYYYKYKTRWYAINPATGLAIPGIFHTRKDAQNAAYKPDILERIEKYIDSRSGKQAIATFSNLKLEAMTAC